MTTPSTYDLVIQNIAAVAPINPSVAASLTELSVRILNFESKFRALEQRAVAS